MLYVDDEPGLLEIVKLFLEDSGEFLVMTYSRVSDALKALASEHFDVIISDYQMPEMDGIEFLKKVKQRPIAIPFILFTGRGREEVAIEAINNGAEFYIRKGTDTKAQFAELTNVIRQAVARRTAEEAVTYNLRHYRTLIEKTTDIITEVGPDGMIRYISPSVKHALGYESEGMIGRNIKEFAHPDDVAKIDGMMFQITNEGVGEPFEVRVISKCHAWRVLEICGTKSESKDTSLVINAHDVTERNRMEFRLKNLNRMHTFLSGINQSILHSNDENEIYRKCCLIAVEKGLFKMAWVGVLGSDGRIKPVARQGEAGDYLDDIVITINDDPSGCGPCGTSIKSNRIVLCNDIANDPITVPWRESAAKNGYNSMIIIPIRLHGKPRGAFGLYSEEINVFTGEEIALLEEIAEDISFAISSIDLSSRQKVAEEALKDSEERYRSLFDNMREGFAYCRMIFDPEGRPEDWIYLKVNPAFYKQTGLENIEGKRVREVMPDIMDLNPELFDIYGDVAKTGKAKEFEIEFKPLKLSLKVSAFSPRPDHFVAIFEDFTHHLRMADERLTGKKLELLGKISMHDIFNQIMVINGTSEYLRKKGNNENLDKYLEMIFNASEKIDQVLQFGKQYAAIGVQAPVWTNVQETIDRIIGGFEDLRFNIDSSLNDVRIYADPLIERVFFNLFDNSIRHGKRTTEINITWTETSEGTVLVIEDNGIGVSAEDKERLFKYGQGKNTGFGLYLCREILAITDLSIEETGDYGKGARFEIRVPLDKTEVVGQ